MSTELLVSQGVQKVNIRPTSAMAAGSIAIFDGYPYVTPNEIIADSVNAGFNAWGGEYRSSETDAAMTGGDVYWDAENEKFSQTASGAVHFGRITPGCGCTEAGGPICVIHNPNGTVLAVSDDSND